MQMAVHGAMLSVKGKNMNNELPEFCGVKIESTIDRVMTCSVIHPPGITESIEVHDECFGMLLDEEFIDVIGRVGTAQRMPEFSNRWQIVSINCPD